MAFLVSEAYDLRTISQSGRMRLAYFRPAALTELVKLTVRTLDLKIRWEDLKIEPGSLPVLTTATAIPQYMYSWFPPLVFESKIKDQLVDVLRPAGCINISQKLKNIIEAHAPGAVQFIPVKLVTPDNTQIEDFGARWFMNVLNYVDPKSLYEGTRAVVHVENDTTGWGEPYEHIEYELYRAPKSAMQPSDRCISAQSFSGMNLFITFQAVHEGRPRKHYSGPGGPRIFVSDRLGQAMRKERITGVTLEKYVEA